MPVFMVEAMQATSPVIPGQPFPQEFEDLFREHYVLVYRTAYGVTGRVEDAEDVVQTVFLRLLQRDFRLTTSAEATVVKKAEATGFLKNPKGYLYRAAVNRSLTIVQTRQRRARTETGEELAISVPSRASSQAEALHQKLYEAIAQLKPKAASILILRYLHNYSDADIAKLLGTSRGVIAVTLYRSRARLKKLMGASRGEEL